MRRIFAQERKREKEHQEVVQLAQRGVWQKIPAWSVIHLQDLAARRRQRAADRHKEAERKAGIPAKQKRWEADQDRVIRSEQRALIEEDERHFHARQAIIEEHNKQRRALGDYPSLPPPEPAVAPSVPFTEGPEKARAKLGASVRELDTAQLGSAPELPKPSRARA